MQNFLKNKTVFLALALLAATLLMGGCFRKSISNAPPVKQPATRPEAAAPVVVEESAEESAETRPGVIDETYELDAEETYELDAVDEVPLPEVDEGDLGDDTALAEEAAPEPSAAEPTAEAEPVAEPMAADEAGPVGAEEPAATEVAPESTPAEVTDPAPVAAEPVATAATEPTPEPEPVAEESTPEFIDPEEEVVEVNDGPEFMVGGEAYYLQVGAFSVSANAEKVLADLIAQGYEGSIVTMSQKGYYLVRAGSFTDRAGAAEALKEVKKQFPGSYIVKWNPAAK